MKSLSACGWSLANGPVMTVFDSSSGFPGKVKDPAGIIVAIGRILDGFRAKFRCGGRKNVGWIAVAQQVLSRLSVRHESNFLSVL